MCAIVGETGALARQAVQHRLQLGSACQRRDIHIVDKGKIRLGIDGKTLDQPRKRRSVLGKALLLKPPRVVLAKTELLLDEATDAALRLQKNRRTMRIQRVVEIEEPSFDMAEIGLFR